MNGVTVMVPATEVEPGMKLWLEEGMAMIEDVEADNSGITVRMAEGAVVLLRSHYAPVVLPLVAP